MSLLRLAFWLALIVLLLPTDAQQQARLSHFANNAMQRVATFCDRNGRSCAAGSELWAAFLKKAEFAVRLVGDLLGAGGRQFPQEGSEAPPRPDRRVGRAESRQAPDLLPPSDVYSPPWRPRVRLGHD